MHSNLNHKLDPSRSTNTVSRRRMLQVGCVGTAVSLGAPTSLLALAADQPSRKLDFGPDYHVLNVRNHVSGTQVVLGFHVNGRSFNTELNSVDGRVWRPV